MQLLNEIGKHPAKTEADFLCWYFGKAYKVPQTAVRIDRHLVTPATDTRSDSIKLFLTIRLGSSPTSGTEIYQRLDVAKLFDGVEEIRMGAGGVPTPAEFKTYILKMIAMPMDGIDISVIGNAFTLAANPNSLLFTGKKTLYVR